MSNFSIKLNASRPCRYVFEANLWESRNKKFGLPLTVLLDTGAYNTVIHKSLVASCGTMLKQTMKVAIGGFRGEANLCILHSMKIGGVEMQKIVALAVPFEDELKDHILIGANAINNWEITLLSRQQNRIEAFEQFSKEALARKYPYRYCFDNKGRIMALLELDNEA